MKTQNLAIDLTSPELTQGLLDIEKIYAKELSAMATDSDTDDDTNNDDIETERHKLALEKKWNKSGTALRMEKVRYRHIIQLLATELKVHIPPDEICKKLEYEQLKMVLFEMIRLWLKRQKDDYDDRLKEKAKKKETERVLEENIEDDWDPER